MNCRALGEKFYEKVSVHSFGALDDHRQERFNTVFATRRDGVHPVSTIRAHRLYKGP